MIAIYIRVSTTEQNLEGQRAEIKRYLKGHGIKPSNVQWYEDKATGANLDRPAFKELEHAIFMGEVEQVIVWRLDRLSRSMRDGINLLHDWLEKGVKVVSVTQALDLSGTVGRMVAGVLLGVAQMEREAISERQMAGIAVAKKAGVYKNNGRKPGTFKAKPARAKKLREQGLTQQEIATAMGVSTRTVIRYLK